MESYTLATPLLFSCLLDLTSSVPHLGSLNRAGAWRYLRGGGNGFRSAPIPHVLSPKGLHRASGPPPLGIHLPMDLKGALSHDFRAETDD